MNLFMVKIIFTVSSTDKRCHKVIKKYIYFEQIFFSFQAVCLPSEAADPCPEKGDSSAVAL